MKLGQSGIKKRFSKYFPLCTSVWVNILILVVTLVFFRFVYIENDDQAMNFIAAGAFGSNSEYLVFINILYGYVLKFLYSINENVNWYVISMYGLMLLDWIVIGTVLFKKAYQNKSLMQGAIIFFILWTFSNFGYRFLQFTHVSAITCIAGFLVLIDEWESPRAKNIIFGMLLVIFGSFIRIDSLGMVGFLFGLYTLWCFLAVAIKERWNFRTSQLKKQFLLSMMMLSTVIICGLFSIINTQIYKSDPIWREYLSYNQARSELLDYPTKMPDDEKKELRSVVYSGDYYDTEVFTAETMKELASFRVYNQMDFKEMIKSGFELLTNASKSDTTRYLYIIPIIVLAFALLFNRKWIYSLIALIYVVLLYIYLFWAGRYGLVRIHYGILLGFCVFLIYNYSHGRLAAQFTEFFKSKPMRVYLKRAAIIGISIAFALFAVVPTIQTGLADKINDESMRVNAPETYNVNYLALENIIQNKDNLYLEELIYSAIIFNWSGNTYNVSIHQNVKKDFFDNVVCLGGWDTYSKRNYEILKQYGVENPFRALIEKDNVYYISTNTDIPNDIVDYLRRHYEYEGQCELVFVSSPYYVYKF